MCARLAEPERRSHHADETGAPARRQSPTDGPATAGTRPYPRTLGRLLGTQGAAAGSQPAGSQGFPGALRRQLPGRPVAQRLAAAAGPAARLGRFYRAAPCLSHGRRPRGALLRRTGRYAETRRHPGHQGAGRTGPSRLARAARGRRRLHASGRRDDVGPADVIRRRLEKGPAVDRGQPAQSCTRCHQPRGARYAATVRGIEPGRPEISGGPCCGRGQVAQGNGGAGADKDRHCRSGHGGAATRQQMGSDAEPRRAQLAVGRHWAASRHQTVAPGQRLLCQRHQTG